MPYPLLDPFYDPYGPVATFLIKGVQPPAAQYIGPSDQLQLTVFSPNVPTTFMLGLRLLDLKGEVQPLSYKIIVPATAGGSFVEVITPGECFLLSAVITDANVRRGQCWARLNLQRGNPTGGAAVGMVLIAGYATATDTIGFPGTPSTDSLSGSGASLVYAGPVPALGVAPSVTCPPGTRWNVVGLSATIAAGFVFSSQRIYTITTAGGAIKVLAAFMQTEIADVAGNELMQSGAVVVAGDSIGFVANAGDVIEFTEVQGVGAGNQYGALSVMVEEFVEI